MVDKTQNLTSVHVWGGGGGVIAEIMTLVFFLNFFVRSGVCVLSDLSARFGLRKTGEKTNKIYAFRITLWGTWVQCRGGGGCRRNI